LYPAYFIFIMTSLLGCGYSKNVMMVKNGDLSHCPNVTVGQMVDSFFRSPSWESVESRDGELLDCYQP
jgi:hypothetical protein